ncbi:MAG: hypothetical protein ABI761_02525 [Saprospiraceae bacterium]
MSNNLFQQFLALFPPVELPVSLTLDSHRTFEQVNDLVPFDLANQFILQEDELPEEEFTEYLPCFKLPEDKKEYFSLVYWKAALMRYDFILATYTKTGIPISRQVIAGTASDGKTVSQKVATIQPDYSIDVIASVQDVDVKNFDPAGTKELYYELMPNGFISQLNENEN